MDGLRIIFILLFISSLLHRAPASVGLGNKVLHIPEKIIGGVIDIVQSHKNKPSQQSTFQQSVQTQTTFSQHGNLQGSAGNGQQWMGPVQQGAGFQGQAQFQTQIGYGNQGTGHIQGTPSQVYPGNNGQVPGIPGQYPVNSGPYQQQGFSQSQNQEQSQNHQNQFQNQQVNFQTQNQNQGQNQNGHYQSGQYGTDNFQGTGQYGPSNGNYQNVGQSSGTFQNGQNSGNYHGGGQGNSGNYQGVGQGSSGHYQTVGQASGGTFQNGNHQNVQTGQYQGSNGQHNQNQSSYYQGSQTGQTSSGSISGNFGSQSSGFQSSQQSGSGGQGPSCVCQAWSKPPTFHDELPKSDKHKSDKTEEKKPDV